ncbi:MAG: FAD-binding oxidoreductase [Pseudomonadaceae bacterium]|nr:FAD-binding oxidoreductase [Pseudomonadaceae bacterium]
MLAELHEILSPQRVLTDDASLAHYGRDWTRSYEVAPSAIVFPESAEEVASLVKWARATATALVPSGGRTGLSGGAVASNGEVVVSFERMNRILDFDAADGVVSVQAGVITQALQDFAQEKGLYYPVDFASSGSSHIGGNIATNAGGIKVIRYGLTRDWVAGLTVVTGAGEILKLNHALVKNATGYDLRHLFVGSEGTLGFVVEAQIQLTPAPAEQQVMVLGIERFTDIVAVLDHFKKTLPLSAFEFFSELALSYVTSHRDLPRPLQQPTAFYALLEFDEDRLDDASAAFEGCVEAGWVVDGVLSNSRAQSASLWQLREGISESIAPKTPYKNDVSVRIGDMESFIDETNALVTSAYPDFDVCWYGHIGDGNLHINILKPDSLASDVFHERCHEISPQIFAAVQKRDGSISAEHGVGLLKRDFLGFSRSDAERAAMAAIKTVFDPDGIMNPGKLLSE